MKETRLVILFFVLISAVFFYKTIFLGFVPFPGDLLVAEYNPWKTYSYLGYNPGSYPNKAQYFDVLRQLYPWKAVVIEQIKNGQLPLWNPYNFSGSPLLANFQSGVFYPLGILYFLFPQVVAWTMLVMLQPLLMGIFTYFFAKKIGLSRIGSLFPAISFAFSSFMTVWLEYNTIGHVILWLPLSLLAVEKLIDKKTIFWGILFIASLVFALLAGHPQIAFYSILFLIFYIIFRIRALKKLESVRKELLFFGILIFLPIGISAVQLIPGIELIQQSARSPHNFDFLINKILIQPWQLVMLIVADFFGNPATRNYWPYDTYIGKVTSIGLISLVFVLLSFTRLRQSLVRFFLILAGVVLVLATNNPFTLLFFRFEIPFLSSSSPTLAIFIFCFALSILAGFGVDAWLQEDMKIKQIIKWISPIFIVFFLLWIAVLIPQLFSEDFASHKDIAMRNLLYSTALFFFGVIVLIARRVRPKFRYILIGILLIVQTADLFRGFQKFNPFVASELVFPNAPVLEFLQKQRGIDRFWGYGNGSIEANFATQYSLFSPDGYDPLYPRRYGEFIQSSKDGKIATEFSTQTRSDAVIQNAQRIKDVVNNKYSTRILDMLGVKYILSRELSDAIFLGDRFKKLHEDNGWIVYENLKAAPRVFFTSHYQIVRSNEEFEDKFFAEDFKITQTILLEKDVNLESKNDTGANVNVILYTPNTVKLSTNSNAEGLVFLSDTYYPGWKAFVDGRATQILRANYAFRAVVVPSGEHTVVFKYDPDSVKWGAGISLGTLFVCILALLYINKNGKILVSYNGKNE